MASSSSFSSNSQYCPQWKYVVFLSFRGEDTRKTFTGHLYEGLKNRGILTFQDDKRLEQGDSIPEELMKAIEKSQIALVVFSRNYATSRWCLNELVKIMKCKEEENGQTVIPIFYDVDPSHVRNQSESFAVAFAEHESRYKDDVEGMQKVQGWRTALTAAANLKGYDIRDGIESEKIQLIVDYISSKFCKSDFSLSFWQDVVGINDHLERLKSRLQIEINDVRIVGIWGIGGIGKTTIAKAVFDTLSHQFKAACFLANVKENAKKNQLHSLQNTLLSEVLRKKDDYVNNEYDGKCMIQSRLSSMKVLIVLDDIDHGDHLEYLAGDVGWFGNGSRVIVTTRNRHLIEKDAAIYEVPTLLDDEAMQLFNQHAFKKEVPDECFKKFSLEVVNYAKGLPLALKLQQFLSLRRIDLSGSKSLKRTPDFKGMPNLEYLDLRDCSSLEEVHPSLKYCKKLIQLNLSYCKSLERFPYVNVESLEFLDLDYYNSLEKFPEFLGIMKRKLKITMSYSGIRELSLSFFDLQPHLTELHLRFMKNLVSLPSSICKSKGLVKLDVSNCSKLESLPEEIGDLENLEELDASYTLISRPPSSIVRLNKLKSLQFQKRKSEDRVYFVFPLVNDGLLSLESLDLRYCNIMDGGLPEDIGSLSSLKELKLCENNFEHLPRSIVQLGALEYLDLSHCERLTQLPEDIGSLSSLKELKLHGNNFVHLPRSIAQLGSLEYLDLSDCKKLTQLPEFPQQLHVINADWCNDSFCNSLFQNISSLQHAICSSHSLSLRVFRSLREDIPSWFKYQGMGTSVSVNLPTNWYVSDNFLGFAVCYSGKLIDYITAHLIPVCDDVMSSMTQESLSNNSIYSDDRNIINFLLVPLGGLWDASNANGKTPNDYGCIKLNFIGKTCDDFGKEKKIGVRLFYKNESELCIGIRKSRYEEDATCSSSKKQRQHWIDLTASKSLKRTPDFKGMPNLEYLNLEGCTSLEEVHPSLKYCRKLIELNLWECESLERFPYVNVESLESLDLDVCYSLEKFTEILGIMKPDLEIKMSCSGIRELPLYIIDLQPHLTELDLSGMENLVSLPSSIQCKNLIQLSEFPQQLYTIDTDWSNDWICNSLFQNISSLQHDIYASDSLSLRVFKSWWKNIPSWFHHQGMRPRVSVNLPENWYVSDKFLGFVVCYSGKSIDYITTHLIPLCDDGVSLMTRKFEEKKKSRVRLLYKEESELHIGVRKSRYEEEATCFSSKKQRLQVD
ncbi:hypothetical protein RDI58_026014 [Solanum bulbocastanum]|uniref:ADP-ribosyl cyclase/cyclic ADP-ribose hydrolase n=1 Tax=Solanum bulbocastanum TaxID=147425 RepID=A0AAN8SZF3_SOLBU